jgi:hypothetical protein
VHWLSGKVAVSIKVKDGWKDMIYFFINHFMLDPLTVIFVRVVKAVSDAVTQHTVGHTLPTATRELGAGHVHAEPLIRAVLAVRPEVAHQRVVQGARAVTAERLYDNSRVLAWSEMLRSDV